MWGGGVKLLGVTIDHDLKFNEHIGNIARKVSKQIQVLQRHKKLIDIHAKVKLYNAYLLPHLNYCSIVWHHCGKGNSNKLENLMNVRCALFTMMIIARMRNYYCVLSILLCIVEFIIF